MAGFTARRAEGGHNSGEQRHFVIKNSAVLSVGEAVNFDSGYLDSAGATERVLGIIEGFVDSKGLPLVAQHVTGSDFSYTGNPGSETVTVASDNATVSMVKAVVNIDHRQEYYNDADDDLTAAMLGTYFDTNSGGLEIDVATTGSTGQFVLMELDPDDDGDASKGIFRIAEHALHLG